MSASILNIFLFLCCSAFGSDTLGVTTAFFLRHNKPSMGQRVPHRAYRNPLCVYSNNNQIYLLPDGNMSMQEEATSRQIQDRPLVQIAPMLDITYFEFRQFMRMLTKRAQLWSEMMPDASLIYGEKEKVDQMLQCSRNESPLVLQLGGNNVENLTKAAKIALAYGYDEVNINAGCPSSRVSGKGCFGAALMNDAPLVARIVEHLRNELTVPVTVKHRLGVDHNDSYEFVRDFVSTVAEKGCTHFIVHARKAWLNGINPRQNRSIPPLHHDRVYKLCQEFPHLNFSLNGGVKTLAEIKYALEKGVYGVMVGRLAYENPCELVRVDTDIYGEKENPATCKTRRILLESYADFIDANAERNKGTNVCLLVKPILGTFHGEAGTKIFRQALSDMNAYETLEFPKGKTKSAQFIHRAIHIMESVNPEALDRPLH